MPARKVLIVARDDGEARGSETTEIAATGRLRSARMPATSPMTRPVPRMVTAVIADAWRRRCPDQQRRPFDPSLDRDLVRSLARLRASDAAELLRGGPPDARFPAAHGRAAQRSRHRRSLRSGCSAMHRDSPAMSHRRPRSRPLRAAPHRSIATRAFTSRSSTCRWCARR